MNDLGKLIPQGGGEVIPLLREHLTIGRRDSCDVCLRFSNVSGRHCELLYIKGAWVLVDLGSRNGVKVNDDRVTRKVLHPGDVLSIAKHNFVIQYNMVATQEVLDELSDDSGDIMSQPLLEKAGLVVPERRPGRKPAKFDPLSGSYLDDEDDA